MLDEYRAAQLQNADRPEAHLNLGTVHASRGELDQAKRSYETALAIGPWFVPASVNLADVYRAQNRDAEGERVLRQGLERAPDSGTLHHALGLLLVRLGRNPEATLSLQRAAELAPANARFAYVHAVALHSAGQVEQALHRLRTASERHPSDRDLLQALAAMSRDAGHTQQAGEALRRLEALTEGAAGSR